jgi:hypothetical protein
MKAIHGTAAACLMAACLACGGNDEGPALETQTITPPQATATPERVQGCLHAGEASGTFVLTASATDTKMDAATYQLLGTPETLREHVGKRVEVSGTIVAEQTAQTRGATAPAEDRAKGTSGTPTVQASTELEVKRLQVAGVTPVAGDCEPDKSGR